MSNLNLTKLVNVVCIINLLLLNRNRDYAAAITNAIKMTWTSLHIFKRRNMGNEDPERSLELDPRFNVNFINFFKFRYITLFLKLAQFLRCDREDELSSILQQISHVAKTLLVYKITVRKRRPWVRPMFRKRETEGEFRNLFPQLRLQGLENHFDYFRMTPLTFDVLLAKVSSKLQLKDTQFRKAIPPAEQLAMTLRYLAHGDSQKVVALAYRVGFSTVSKIIPRTCQVLWEVLSLEFLKMPRNEEWKTISNQFLASCKFPNCLGAIDCKQIATRKPKSEALSMFKYKDCHSIVLMAACDSDYQFTMADIGTQGRFSDGMFSSSSFGKKIEQGKLDLPLPTPFPGTAQDMPHCFLADESFQLLLNVMCPFPGKKLSQEKAVFNYRLSRGRSKIQNTFGILCARWGVFHKPIHASVPTAISIVKAAICLHNFLIVRDMFMTESLYCPSHFADQEDSNGTVTPGQWRTIVESNGALRPLRRIVKKNNTPLAKDNRDKFVKFLSSARSTLA